MALRIHNLLLDVLKNIFREVDEAIFEDVESPYKLIFCILCIEKGNVAVPEGIRRGTRRKG
jgi:hypothetical protein